MSKQDFVKDSGSILEKAGLDEYWKEKGMPIKLGAVYYRRSNPPEKDWERDYAVAVEDGLNIFRLWVLWGAVNYAPGKYNWEPYDHLLDLAAKYDIKIVLAEFVTDVPEWLYSKYPHARREHFSGRRAISRMHISSATGGHQAMCLDNPEIKQAAEEFLIELAGHYKEYPALYGYDIWNECSMYSRDNLCYCPATQEAFREWLKKKYNNNLSLVNEAWRRYSYTAWEQIELSREVQPYPDTFDTIEFFNYNAFKWMKWRAEILSSNDPKHYIIAHGNAKSFADIAPACGDDWRAAEIVDKFGYTYWYANECHPLFAVDMIRSASKGKEFWRAEAIGNSDWEGREVEDSYHFEKDAMSDPTNIRLDFMISLMGGARGYLNPRWRPLQDGPLFGAYGWYGMDGCRTNRSQIVSSLAKWANSELNKELWPAMPIKGDIGILLLEESQANCYAFHSNTNYYSLSIQGCYEAFKDSNIQADIIKIDQISDYSIVYIPYPLGLSNNTIDKIRQWVANGGFLISEGCFGYFNEHGHAFEEQPNRGFKEIFGCVEDNVSFAPDKWKDLKINTLRGTVEGALYYQSYKPISGEPLGVYRNGKMAIVKNKYAKGLSIIIGSMVGYAYKERPNEQSRKFFASLLEIGGKRPSLNVPYNTGIIARLCTDKEKVVLWVLNETEIKQRVIVEINPDIVKFNKAFAYRGSIYNIYQDNRIEVEIDEKDATILKLY